MKPIMENAKAYNLAFGHFNKELFLGKLKAPMLILTRDARVVAGHFAARKWADEEGELIHEIAINANWMIDGDPMTLFCVLAHEMCHLWQFDHGKPTRGGYHNEEWMKQAHGLGLKTEGAGQQVHTEIEPGGSVEAAIASMPEAAVFPWMSAECVEGDEKGGQGKQGKSGIRARYTCPACGLNAWAKPGANLVCGDDGSPLVEQKKKQEEIED
jgi:hypothetical protein